MGRTISKASIIAKSETARMLQREAEKNVVAEEGIALDAQLMEGFVKRFLAHKFDGELPTPDFHREMWAKCTDSSIEKSADAAPRGHAKSTRSPFRLRWQQFCFVSVILCRSFRTHGGSRLSSCARLSLS
jgi:hypothetical protein